MNWVGMAIVAAIVAVLIILAFIAGAICGYAALQEKMEKETDLLVRTIEANTKCLKDCYVVFNLLNQAMETGKKEGELDVDSD